MKLTDVDIEIKIRSGKAELVSLKQLMQVIVTSAISVEGTELALTENEIYIKSSFGKNLITLTNILQSRE
jgi:hypothetical protein